MTPDQRWAQLHELVEPVIAAKIAQLDDPEARALLEAIVNLFATNGPRLIRDAEQELVDDLVHTWTREGTRPGHHREQQERVRRAWPALVRAIEELVTRVHA